MKHGFLHIIIIINVGILIDTPMAALSKISLGVDRFSREVAAEMLAPTITPCLQSLRSHILKYQLQKEWADFFNEQVPKTESREPQCQYSCFVLRVSSVEGINAVSLDCEGLSHH